MLRTHEIIHMNVNNGWNKINFILLNHKIFVLYSGAPTTNKYPASAHKMSYENSVI